MHKNDISRVKARHYFADFAAVVNLTLPKQQIFLPQLDLILMKCGGGNFSLCSKGASLKYVKG